MSHLFKITFTRKQVTTDYLPGGSTREITTMIEETIGGLPGSTVANYRKVLGDQIVSVAPDDSYESGGNRSSRPSPGVTQAFGLGAAREGRAPSPERGTSIAQGHKPETSEVVRAQITGPAAGVVENEDDPFGMSYADIVNKMVEKGKVA